LKYQDIEVKVMFSGIVLALAIGNGSGIQIAQLPSVSRCPGKMNCPESYLQPIYPVPGRPVIGNQNSIKPIPIPKPFPAGTPCGATVINGQNVFVAPQSPGSYCDRDGTLQYQQQ
jgi:hypothetical protein